VIIDSSILIDPVLVILNGTIANGMPERQAEQAEGICKKN
jgi:hypothetical protein